MDYKSLKTEASQALVEAIINYLDVCYSELHSQRVKAGIKAAKERKQHTKKEASTNE